LVKEARQYTNKELMDITGMNKLMKDQKWFDPKTVTRTQLIDDYVTMKEDGLLKAFPKAKGQ
jgi:hypothetical protein